MALPLAQWQAQERSFLQLAEQATSQLVVQLVQHQIQETGYFMLCHYRYLATEYVLVTLLGSKDYFSVTPDLLLSTDQHLDIARMQLAARIDLTEYQTSPEQNKYISFIRGRAGRKVADFFLDFLGCAEGVIAKSKAKWYWLLLKSICQPLIMMPAKSLQCASKSMSTAKSKANKAWMYTYRNFQPLSTAATPGLLLTIVQSRILQFRSSSLWMSKS